MYRLKRSHTAGSGSEFTGISATHLKRKKISYLINAINNLFDITEAVHFRILFLDGVYVERPDGSPRFRWVQAPTSRPRTTA
jgi:hypothetical protein